MRVHDLRDMTLAGLMAGIVANVPGISFIVYFFYFMFYFLFSGARVDISIPVVRTRFYWSVFSRIFFIQAG